MDAPTPKVTVEPFNFLINQNEKILNIQITYKSENIIFFIEEQISIPPKTYEKSYSKSDFENISKIFKMFDNNIEVFNKIIELFKNKNFDVLIEEKKIIFKYKNDFTEFSFDIPIKENKDINFLINNLYKIVKELKDENIDLKNNLNNKEIKKEKEIEEIKKENNELKNLINELIISNKKEIEELKKENNELKNKQEKAEKEIEEIKKITNEIKEEKERIKNNDLYKSTIIKDEEEIKLLSDWINENKEKKFKLLYKLSLDGDSIETFHKKCDNKGPTLIIIKTTKNYIFGGYNPISWNSSGSYQNSNLSFLFSLNKKKKYTIKQGLEGYAIYFNKDRLAFGGGHDLCIFNQCTYNNNSYTNSPHSYNTTETNELNGGEVNFTVIDYEVYSVEF